MMNIPPSAERVFILEGKSKKKRINVSCFSDPIFPSHVSTGPLEGRLTVVVVVDEAKQRLKGGAAQQAASSFEPLPLRSQQQQQNSFSFIRG
jgi:hypothetical protein